MRTGSSARNASTFKQSDSLRTKQEISRLIIEEKYDGIIPYFNASSRSKRELLTILAELGLPYRFLPKIGFRETLHWFLAFLTTSTQSYSKKIPWYEFDPTTFKPECQLISLEDPFFSIPQHPTLKATLNIIVAELGSQFTTCCLFPTNPTELFIINYLAPDSNTPLSSVIIEAHAKEEGPVDAKSFLQKITATKNVEDILYLMVDLFIELFKDASLEHLDHYARTLNAISAFSLIFELSITRLFIITNTLLKGANASSLSLDGSMQNMVTTFISFCHATKHEARLLYIQLLIAPMKTALKLDLTYQEQQGILTWIQASRAYSVNPKDMALKHFAEVVGFDTEAFQDSDFQANAPYQNLDRVRSAIVDQLTSTAETTRGNSPWESARQ